MPMNQDTVLVDKMVYIKDGLIENIGDDIEVMGVANMILVDKNPLSDLSVLQNPLTVFIKGRKINRKTLDSFEEKAMSRKNLIASAVRYLENLIVEK